MGTTQYMFSWRTKIIACLWISFLAQALLVRTFAIFKKIWEATGSISRRHKSKSVDIFLISRQKRTL